jgi:hypothetical protein
MTINNQIIRRKIRREILFLMCHIDTDTLESDVLRERQPFSPFFIVVPAHGINGSDIGQSIENSLIVDITAVKYDLTLRERVKHCRPEKTVCIRNNAYSQYTLP